MARESYIKCIRTTNKNTCIHYKYDKKSCETCKWKEVRIQSSNIEKL